MAFDYHATKRDLLDRVQHIGRAQTPAQAEEGMSITQLKRRRAPCFMTDEKWQYRRLNGGALVVEITYGWFLDMPLFGLTVFCVRDLHKHTETWDHALSGAQHSVGDVIARLHKLDSATPEELAAMVAEEKA